MVNLPLKLVYCIFKNSFRGNYSFLNQTLCTVTFDHSTYRCGNYSREETIKGRKLFAEIQYLEFFDTIHNGVSARLTYLGVAYFEVLLYLNEHAKYEKP